LKRAKNFKPKDFMPRIAQRKQTTAEMMAVMKMAASQGQHGKEVGR